MVAHRLTFADRVRRAATLLSVFLAGGIGGYVTGKLDLLDRPRAVAAGAADTALLADSGLAADTASLSQRAAAGDVAPPAAAAAPVASDEPALPLGEVRTGPPARDSAAGTASPLPTRAELEALRGLLAVPVAGFARDSLRDSFEEGRSGGRTHHALDILAPRGTAVVSAADGTLRKLFTSDAGGLMVYASDPTDRFVLAYAHLDAYADGLREGMPLRRGQPLGVVGTTGNAPPNTPHLHFAIFRVADAAQWWRGTAVDPYALLKP